MKQFAQLHNVVILQVILIFSHGFLATLSNSATVTQDRINNGGTFAFSTNYKMIHHIGQPVSGQFNTASHQMNTGYLHEFLDAIIRLGDINGDGSVDLKDVINSLQVLTGGNLTELSTAGDVNADSQVGLEEVIYDLKKASE